MFQYAQCGLKSTTIKQIYADELAVIIILFIHYYMAMDVNYAK